MHAWSEVEHDFIYKNPYQLPPDPTIDRMVDAVNGLAITGSSRQMSLHTSAIYSKSKRRQESWIGGLSWQHHYIDFLRRHFASVLATDTMAKHEKVQRFGWEMLNN